MRRISLLFSGSCGGVVQRVASLILAGLLLVIGFSARSADVPAGQRLFIGGSYTQCVALAEQSLKAQPDNEEWQLLLAQSLLAVGRYPDARTVVTNALARGSRSLRLRWLAREVFRSNGQPDAADAVADEIIQLVSARASSYRDPADIVAFGRAALLRGGDPKRVLDRAYDVAKTATPPLREAYLASGELALEKHDFAIAAKQYQEGLKKFPDDPDLNFGLAQAYAPSEGTLALESLEAALKVNSNHVGCLLMLAEHAIDAEQFAEAEQLLVRVLAINPWHPEAWAYRAVAADLQNQPELERAARAAALKFWPTNPRVPQLIGLKLSQKYRFVEGAALQRQALEFDRNYLPAKAQLAQDLLRLGEEDEGWRLADEVQRRDGYDQAALNLVNLHDAMAKYRTLTNDHFIVRMTPLEATLYGSNVLELLDQVRGRLCAKYGLELTNTVLVEVFADQKDFAVRTFGMPWNEGYLGVCFGHVITANSPASRPGHPFNWEAMLWHEFCHVVTLNLTRNRMPRWLSEGISVYEEHQANSSWGEHLNPHYREMILEDELTPLSKLSAAFMSPKSEIHLQFAYYEAALAVQFLVEHYGLEKLKAILRDLGNGAEINQAIEKNTAPMATVEKDFAEFASQTAEKMAPGLDWQKPDLKTLLPGTAEIALEAWTQAHPTNFYVMTRQADEFMEGKKWTEARAVLQRLVELYPDSTGPESAYRQLAAVHRALGQTNDERQVLARFVEKDDAASDACLRLMELAADARDWPAVSLGARRYLAINPLVPAPYRFLARAGDEQGEARTAIEAYRALLQLDPANPAEVHFKLAQQLHRVGDPSAKRHVLQALEEAPRYREALRLLLEIDQKQTAAATGVAPASPLAR